MNQRLANWFAVPCGLLVTLVTAPSPAQNVLINGGFEAGGAPTSLAATFTPGASAATAWDVWNNSPGTTTTELVASTDPFSGGGGKALHVVTEGADNGLYQIFTEQSPAFSSVDVLVSSGRVQLSLSGAGGFPLATLALASAQWQHIAFDLPDANEIIIYSVGGATDFVVDNAWVASQPAPVPEPSTVVGIGTALLCGGAFVFWGRRSRG